MAAPSGALGAPNNPHECDKHDSPLLSRCNMRTNRKTLCRRPPKVFSNEYLPVCRQHSSQHGFPQTRAGNCQAIADCGLRCNRLAGFCPPFHFCDRHANGTKTLPCYLLKLPVELRDMIWERVLPETIAAWKAPQAPFRFDEPKKIFPLLLVNKMVSEEALSVAYKKVPFEVKVSGDSILLGGTHIYTHPVASFWGPFWGYHKEEAGTVFDLTAGRMSPVLGQIRNFSITVELGAATLIPAGITHNASTGKTITREDYYIFHLRQTVKKFIQLLQGNDDAIPRNNGSNQLRSLEIRFQFGTSYSWSFDEIMGMIALFSEPFKALASVQRPILGDNVPLPVDSLRPDSDLDRFKEEYQAYKSEWQIAMSRRVDEDSNPPAGPSLRLIRQVQQEFREIEKCVGSVHDRNTWSFQRYPPYHSHMEEPEKSPFGDLAKIIHLARVASEAYDLSNLARVRDALLQRWVDLQEKRELEADAVHSSLRNLFKGTKKSQAFLEHKERLTVRKKGTPITELARQRSDLNVAQFIRKGLSPVAPAGKTYVEDRQYRYVYSNGAFRHAILKTPFFIRRNRNQRPG